MIDFSGFGLRDWIPVVTALVGVYLVVMLLRLLRMNIKRRSSSARDGAESSEAVAARLASAAAAYRESSRQEPRSWTSVRPAASLDEVGSMSAAPDFASELTRSRLEQEVHGLRREAQQLRVDLTHLTEEMRQLKTVRNASPLYSEAMSLAQQGVTPDGIADRCGISVGEAELVAALARNRAGSEFQDREDDRDERYHQSGN
jgi:hypothetical protein